jgi:hypothetical protein
MAWLYVAASRELGKWGAEVGISQHLYKVGLAEDGAEEAVATLNEERHAGAADWRLVKTQQTEGVDEGAILERLAAKERVVDPAYYPRIKGARGIFKVKLANVENYLLVKQALAGEEHHLVKPKAADIADYLLRLALG